MIRKLSLALVASAALVSLSAPAFAFDTPKTSGAYSISGTGGVAAITGTVTGTGSLTINANNLTGGDSGLAGALSIGKGTIALAQSGDGGGAGADLTVKDGGTAKLTVKNIDGGWSAPAIAIMGSEKLDIDIPGLGSVVLK